MTEKTIVIQKSFQEKMKERIKESIGELMSDEELKNLVDRGLEEAFFRERKLNSNSWESDKYEKPLIHEILKELLRKSVDKHVSEFIDGHSDDVMEAIKEIHSLGIGNALLNAVNKKFSTDIFNLQTNIEQRLNGQ